jgi:hypothetical protein
MNGFLWGRLQWCLFVCGMWLEWNWVEQTMICLHVMRVRAHAFVNSCCNVYLMHVCCWTSEEWGWNWQNNLWSWFVQQVSWIMFVAVGMFLIESSVDWLWCFGWLWITGYWWLGGWLDGDLHTHCAQCQRLSVCKCKRAPFLHVLILWTLSVDNFEVDCNGFCLCLECRLDETESSKLWFLTCCERARACISC